MSVNKKTPVSTRRAYASHRPRRSGTRRTIASNAILQALDAFHRVRCWHVRALHIDRLIGRSSGPDRQPARPTQSAVGADLDAIAADVMLELVGDDVVADHVALLALQLGVSG
jgi:hypothetical protein